MINTLLYAWESITTTFGNAWEWLMQTPAALYKPLQDKLLLGLNNWASSILGMGGGDRNPVNGGGPFGAFFSGLVDDTVNNWLESLIIWPTTVFEDFLDYPIIAVIFGGGLIFCLGYRLIMWILDILP